MMTLQQLYNKFSGVKLTDRNTQVHSYQGEESCRYLEISPGWFMPIPKGVYFSQRDGATVWTLQTPMKIPGKKSWSPKTVGDLLEALEDLHPRIVDPQWGGNILHEICAYRDAHQMWDHCTRGDQLFHTRRIHIRYGLDRLRTLVINDQLWIHPAPGLEMYFKPAPNGKLYLAIHDKSTGLNYMVGQLKHLEDLLEALDVDPLYRVYRNETEMLSKFGVTSEIDGVNLSGPKPTTVEFEVLGMGTPNRELRFADGVRIPIPRCVSVHLTKRDKVMVLSTYLNGRRNDISRTVHTPEDFCQYYKEICSHVKTVDGRLRVGDRTVNHLKFTQEKMEEHNVPYIRG